MGLKVTSRATTRVAKFCILEVLLFGCIGPGAYRVDAVCMA